MPRSLVWCALAVGASVLMGGIRRQRAALEAEGEDARQEARVDSLTTLHNRRAFDEVLAVEVKRADRLKVPLTVGMVDVTNFKEINDRWGYADGDRCLRDVAIALRTALRDPDFCFRWGGDEFALILSGTPSRDADRVAKRLQGRIASSCRRPDGSPIEIRFGAAQYEEGSSPGDLIERAGLSLAGVSATPGGRAGARRATTAGGSPPRNGATDGPESPEPAGAGPNGKRQPRSSRTRIRALTVVGALAAIGIAALLITGDGDDDGASTGTASSAPTATSESPVQAGPAGSGPAQSPARRVKRCEPIFGRGTSFPVISSSSDGSDPARCDDAHDIVLVALNHRSNTVGDWRCVSQPEGETLAICYSGNRSIVAGR